jgi:hypothetical protein
MAMIEPLPSKDFRALRLILVYVAAILPLGKSRVEANSGLANGVVFQ